MSSVKTQQPKLDPKDDLSDPGAVLLRKRFLVENEDDVKKIYDLWAKNYDTDSFDSLKFDSPDEVARIALAHWPRRRGVGDVKQLDVADRVQVLDVGCGTGAMARALADLSGESPAVTDEATMFGFDLTPSMLQVARAEGHYKGGVRGHSVTEYPWPYKSDSMDMVMCNGVLVYINDPKCMDEFARVTKPGGHVILMIRVDGLHVFEDKLLDLEKQGIWRRHYVSDTRNNFPRSGDFEHIGVKAPEEILYNVYVFRKEK